MLDDIFILSNANWLIGENDKAEVVVDNLALYLRGKMWDVRCLVKSAGQLMNHGLQTGVRFGVGFYIINQTKREAILAAIHDIVSVVDPGSDYGTDVILNLVGKFAVEIAELGIPTTIELKSK